MATDGLPANRQRAIAKSGVGMLPDQVFFAAVHHTRTAMAISDPNLADCALIYVNAAFTDLTGYGPEDAVGRNCRFLQGPDTEGATVDRIRTAVSRGEPCDEELLNYRKDGSSFDNALRISPIRNNDGRLIYFFASQIDVSPRAEAARRQAHHTQTIGAMAAGVAHEVSNLMTVILGGIERASTRSLDDKQADHLKNAHWAAKRTGTLTGELLSLSMRRLVTERRVDLNDLLKGVGDVVAEVLSEKIQLRFDFCPAAVPVNVDPGQLELVLLNLTKNAADAMPEGGELLISTRVLTPAQAMVALQRSAAVEIIVKDTGTGMSKEVLERATELFFTTKRAGSGTGLGLFLALDFAEQAGGKLTFDSGVGAGTTVHMTLPLLSGS